MKRNVILHSAGLVLSLLLFSAAPAQDNWIRSVNSGCYYHTHTPFTWSGGAVNGYCNGYGTIQWYDADGSPSGKYIGYIKKGMNDGYGVQYYANGNKFYDGYWRNDKSNGTGRKYNYDGSLAYEGRFADGELEGLQVLQYAGREVAEYVVRELFDGGMNLKSDVIKVKAGEIHLRITFYGNIIESNYYRMTLVLKNTAPFVGFIDYNDNAELYLKLKLTAATAQTIYDLFKSDSDSR